MIDERDNEVDFARRRPSSGAGSVPPDRDATPPTPTESDGHISAEMLSAWLDDADDASVEQREAIETHLAGCAVCQATLDELRSIVLALAALPQVETPRSFALTPDMVATPQPVNLRATPGRPVVLRESQPWYARQLAALRWATAVAAILFVFVVSADIVSRSSVTDTDDTAAVSTAGGGAELKAASETGDVTAVGGAAIAEDAETLMAEDDQTGASGGEPTPAAAMAEVSDATSAESEVPDAAMDQADAPTEAAANDDAGSGAAAVEPTGEDETSAGLSATEAGSEEADSGDLAREGDVTGGDDAADGTGSLSMQTEGDDVSESTGSTAADADDADSTWRLLQVGLALLIIWLLAAMIALPRLRPRSGHDTE